MCPKSVQHQWKNELDKVKIDNSQYKIYGIEFEHEVILMKNDENPPRYIHKDILIIDEYHLMLNYTKQNNYNKQFLNELKKEQNYFILILSGTPIANDINDIKLLYELLYPNLKFKKLSHISTSLENGILTNKALQELYAYGSDLKYVTLRRNKMEVEDELKGVAYYLYLCKYDEKMNDILMLINSVRKCWGVGNKIMIVFDNIDNLITQYKTILNNNFFGVGVGVGEIVNAENIELKIENFKNNLEIVFVLVDVISHGLNMQFLNYIIFYNVISSNSIYNQTIDRAYRIGQKRLLNVCEFVYYGDEELVLSQRKVMEEDESMTIGLKRKRVN